MTRILALLLLLSVLSTATTFLVPQRAVHITPRAGMQARLRAVSMQETPTEPEAEAPSPAAPEGYSTVYDDEYEDKVLAEKPQLSNTMRERLINESRGLGADPNAKNPFGAVFIGVGVFVLLGALAVNL